MDCVCVCGVCVCVCVCVRVCVCACVTGGMFVYGGCCMCCMPELVIMPYHNFDHFDSK